MKVRRHWSYTNRVSCFVFQRSTTLRGSAGFGAERLCLSDLVYFARGLRLQNEGVALDSTESHGKPQAFRTEGG
jgi:hypothetical protein